MSVTGWGECWGRGNLTNAPGLWRTRRFMMSKTALKIGGLVVSAVVAGAILAGQSGKPEHGMTDAQKKMMDECAANMPKPTEQHAWLQKFVGEWEFTGECNMGPDVPPMQSKGHEKVRDVGGFWIVSEMHSSMMDMPMTGYITLGYDAKEEEYVGTWISSCDGHLWEYEGELNSAGDTLTLECEGPCPMLGGKTAKMRDVVSFKDANHRTMTSSMKGEDGKWVEFMTLNFTKKK